MKRTLAAILAATLAFTALPALADGGKRHSRHGGGGGISWWSPGPGVHHDARRFKRQRYQNTRPYYRQRQRHRSRRYYDGGHLALGGFLGGVVLGTVLSQPRPVYVAPQPAYRNCRTTTGTGYLNGRPAVFGGTWCTDRYGNSFVLPESRHFIRYLG